MEINDTADLRSSIIELEKRKIIQQKILLDQLEKTYKDLGPANILKNTLRQVVAGPGLGSKIVNASVGIGVGLLSKKFMLGTSHGIVKKIIGTALQLGVAGLAVKNGEEIKTTIGGIFKKLFHKKVNDRTINI